MMTQPQDPMYHARRAEELRRELANPDLGDFWRRSLRWMMRQHQELCALAVR